MRTHFATNVWAIFRQDDALEGKEWVAHCLDFDVVTQGRTFEHALSMLGEALLMVISEDLSAGRDPAERRAPEEDWLELTRLASSARSVDIHAIQPGTVILLSAKIDIDGRRVDEQQADGSARRTPRLPGATPQPIALLASA